MAGLAGRAAWPSLVVFAAGLLLLAASLLAGEALRWSAIALLVVACAPWHRPPGGALAVLLGLFCLWLLGNALFATPAYSSEGIYRPLILLGAFVAVASLDRDSPVWLFSAGVVLLSMLVMLGLAQHFFGAWHLSVNPLRAAATFITPNTFATSINLFLLPLFALYLLKRSWWILAASLWLFAGLVATQSRGGMLALFGGLAFVVLCLGWTRLRAVARPIGAWLLGAAALWLIVIGMARLASPAIDGQAVLAPSLDNWVGRPVWDRREIYASTLDLILERPLAGAGANMFWPLFEPVRPAAFGDTTFLFAHNDYLQIWLEYGLTGLVLLGGVVAFALLASRAASRRAPNDALPLACGAALASAFTHAVVDFPLYVPFLLLVIGGYLGALARWLSDAPARPGGGVTGPLTLPVRWALAAAGLAWLAQPMLAQAATAYAVTAMAGGDVNRGLYWQSVARRLEPRNHAHYWAESVIWRNLAIESHERAHMARADQLLAEGIRVNSPYAFNLVLDRARLHRRHGRMLENGAAPEEILGWVQAAVASAPRSVAGQAELARTLAFAGRKEEAGRIARVLRERQPDHPLVRTLAEDI